MDNEDDVYYWTKNQRPPTEHDRYQNTACHYTMSHLKTEGAIIKTYHVDFGEGQLTKKAHNALDASPSMRQDIEPFVRYSVNKKRRWEAQAGVEILGELQKLYPGFDVVLMERVSMRASPYFCTFRLLNYFFSRFKILRIHKTVNCHEEYPAYQCSSISSVYGQPIRHFLATSKQDVFQPKVAGRTTIAYHFITPPVNYEVFHNKSFTSRRRREQRVLHGGLKWWRKMSAVHEEDVGISDVFDCSDLDSDSDSEGEEKGDNVFLKPRRFYNLDNHIVEKFVFVKNNKKISSDV
uniref:Uncharacterized protein n=1 Tax=Caenorhabditis japonica TaxID=281687 RepID=A0A8R1EN78_CAEJA